MKKTAVLFLLLISSMVSGQEILSLDECYRLAEDNYPLASKLQLLEEKTTRELEVLNKEYLPKIDINAKATYQSDVIEFPLDAGGQGMEPVDKDQYQASLDVEQLIFNGGRINSKKRLKEAELLSQKQEVKVDIYQIKKRINKYYFGILQLREQITLLELEEETLDERIQELQSQVKYGAAIPSSEDVLRAEILKIKQRRDEVESQLQAAQKGLSAYIATPVDTTTILELRSQGVSVLSERSRPETELFSLKQEELDQQQGLLSKSLYPNIYGFAQGGYGRPGYNPLDNSFNDFYMVGVKLNWNVFDWGKVKEQKKSLDISRELVEAEKETFTLNNNIELEAAEIKIIKVQEILDKDTKILALREKILKTSDSQLRNGVITASEFLTEFNNLYEAKINQKLHEIDLEMAKADYNVIKGNTEN